MPKTGKSLAARRAGAEKSIYSSRDPVSGKIRDVLRKPNTVIGADSWKKFRDCVRKTLEGRTVTGATGKEKAKAVREQLKAAAKLCSEEKKPEGYTSQELQAQIRSLGTAAGGETAGGG